MCTSPDSARFKPLSNVKTGVCNLAADGQSYEVSATVCPPPRSDVPVCSTFERSFGSSYWTDLKVYTGYRSSTFFAVRHT